VFEGLFSTNIILPFRRRYLKRYKNDYDDPEKRLLTVEEMSRLVNYKGYMRISGGLENPAYATSVSVKATLKLSSEISR